MIDDKDFNDLCDEFESSLEMYPEDQFKAENDTTLTLGNQHWKVHIFCHDDSVEDTREGLLFLFRSRRDLIRPLIETETLGQYIIASRDLAMWLYQRGYTVGLEPSSPWNRFMLRAAFAYYEFRRRLGL